MRFTVRRPASAEVSPCCHRPSGGDVACSVHVGVARARDAGFALENRLALTVFERDVPAGGASLRRVGGRDLLDPTVSFVLQTRRKQTPSASADATIQPAFLCHPRTRPLRRSPSRAGHRSYVKGFDADRVEAPGDVSGGFLDPVLAAVGVPRFQLCDRQLRARSPVGAPLGAGEALLQYLDPPRLTRGEVGCVQQFTGRQGRRHGNATVDTHHAAVTGARDGTGDVRERDKPAPGPIPGDPVGLHTIGNRAREAEAHPADLGHPDPTESAVETLNLMRFDRNLSEPLMYTGFAPGWVAVRSAEKIAHRLGEVPQRLLLNRLRPRRQPVVLGAGRGQLSALLIEAGRAAPRLPMLLLLDGQVPHIPGVPTMLGQQRRLLGGRKQPKSRHVSNVAPGTDKSPKGAAASAPGYSQGFHTATIR